MKSSLTRDAVEILESCGYQVSDCSGSRSCFDILAKRDKVLLIKVLINVDGFSRRCSTELKNVASVTSAIPLVLSDHTKSAKLCRGVIYARYNIQVINLATLGDIVNESMPIVYSVRGNYCMRIDSNLLVKLRKGLNMTQQELADRLGISKHSIHRYELSGRMSLEIAERLMDILKENIATPREVFLPDMHHPPEEYEIMTRRLTGLKYMVLEKFRDIGLFAALTNAPFDIFAIGDEDRKILTTVSDDSRRLRGKMDTINEISRIIKSYSICISNRYGDSDVTVMKPRELRKIKDSEELIDILAGP